jgi:GrpB protein
MPKVVQRAGWDTGDWSGLPAVRIWDYDPRWATEYEDARRAIAQALGNHNVVIEHSGSTAVPGLAARRGIDIMIGVGDPSKTAICIERLVGLDTRFISKKWTGRTSQNRVRRSTSCRSVAIGGYAICFFATTCGHIQIQRRNTSERNGSWRASTAPTGSGTWTARRRSSKQCWSERGAKWADQKATSTPTLGGVGRASLSGGMTPACVHGGEHARRGLNALRTHLAATLPVRTASLRSRQRHGWPSGTRPTKKTIVGTTS